MAEYIEREAVLEFVEPDARPFLAERIKSIPAADVVERASGIIGVIPTADVRPVVRGKWIDRDDKYYGWNMWACSACGEEFVLTEGTPDMNEYHFCPNCGADMREES